MLLVYTSLHNSLHNCDIFRMITRSHGDVLHDVRLKNLARSRLDSLCQLFLEA